MPDKLRRLPEVVADRVESVVVAIASGKNNDAKFHELCFGEAKLHFSRGGGARCGRGGNWGCRISSVKIRTISEAQHLVT